MTWHIGTWSLNHYEETVIWLEVLFAAVGDGRSATAPPFVRTLRALSLEHCEKAAGAIPRAIGECAMLRTLKLGQCKLSGAAGRSSTRRLAAERDERRLRVQRKQRAPKR